MAEKEPKKETKQDKKEDPQKEVEKEVKTELKKEDSKEAKKEEEQPEEKESFLKDIFSISGKGGLYKYVSQARNGIIVEHLESKKRIQAFATMKVSSLEDIAVFTEEEEVPLEEVLKKIYDSENGGEAISHKSDPGTLKEYFANIIPEYDRERVYVSDIKKILMWYNILQGFKMLQFGEPKSAAKKE